jgi:dihydroorotase
VLDASGLLVVRGLVDLHAHVYPQGSAIGSPADEPVPYTATTTYVSAGDAGANNFSALRHFIMAQARSRIFAFLHISDIGLAGFPVGETLNIDYAGRARRSNARPRPAASIAHVPRGVAAPSS